MSVAAVCPYAAMGLDVESSHEVGFYWHGLSAIWASRSEWEVSRSCAVVWYITCWEIMGTASIPPSGFVSQVPSSGVESSTICLMVCAGRVQTVRQWGVHAMDFVACETHKKIGMRLTMPPLGL
jgi:hypothetical protein